MVASAAAGEEEGVQLFRLENGLHEKRASDKIYRLGCLCMRMCQSRFLVCPRSTGKIHIIVIRHRALQLWRINQHAFYRC
jgi:hypothetical protein